MKRKIESCASVYAKTQRLPEQLSACVDGMTKAQQLATRKALLSALADLCTYGLTTRR